MRALRRLLRVPGNFLRSGTFSSTAAAAADDIQSSSIVPLICRTAATDLVCRSLDRGDLLTDFAGALAVCSATALTSDEGGEAVSGIAQKCPLDGRIPRERIGCPRWH
ncbi:hypothetical protein BF49_3847 [Bradyrhizobium sp.]|nr:hypothetical protein BF49_3847 [Bradyrhizobium sp.]